VVVSDALSVRLTGKKYEQKIYKHHSGFIGGLKEVPISRMRERRPEEVCLSTNLYLYSKVELMVDRPKSSFWNVT
jgi:ribosomal protein L13